MPFKPRRTEMSNDARTVFRKQFYKTEMCRYYHAGCVRGASCPFAHGENELRVAPDLIKTSLCQAWMNRSCPLHSQECQFAHGLSDMRATPAFKEYGAHQSTTTKKKRQHRSREGVDAKPEVPGAAPPLLTEATASVPPPTRSADPRHPAKPCPSRANLAPMVPAVAEAPVAGAGDLVGVAIALPAWALPPQLGQVLMLQPPVGDVRPPPPRTAVAAAGPGVGALQRPPGVAPPVADVAAGLDAEVLQQVVGVALPGQGEALAQALLQGLGDRVEMALPEALGAARSRALASALQQAMPDYYED